MFVKRIFTTNRKKPIGGFCLKKEENMEHIGTQTIETERLVLRRFQKGDEKQMFKNYTSSDKVTEFLTWQTHKQESDTKGYLEFVVLPEYEKQSTYRWAIELK